MEAPAAAMTCQPIGLLRSPFAESQGAPIQPSGARGVAGRAELLPHLAPGLKDLEGFSHLILIYHCHLAAPGPLLVKPFLDDSAHGIFATRAPARPNPLGLSVVRLKALEGPVLHLLDVDFLDGTPLLDLKPYVPGFDRPPGRVRTGWLSGRAGGAAQARGDGRFR